MRSRSRLGVRVAAACGLATLTVVACGGSVGDAGSGTAGAGGGAGSSGAGGGGVGGVHDAGHDSVVADVAASDAVADVTAEAQTCPPPDQVSVYAVCRVPGKFCSNGCTDCYCNPDGSWSCGLSICPDAASECPDATPAHGQPCDRLGQQCLYGSGCSSAWCTCEADGGAPIWSCMYAVCGR